MDGGCDVSLWARALAFSSARRSSPRRETLPKTAKPQPLRFSKLLLRSPASRNPIAIRFRYSPLLDPIPPLPPISSSSGDGVGGGGGEGGAKSAPGKKQRVGESCRDYGGACLGLGVRITGGGFSICRRRRPRCTRGWSGGRRARGRWFGTSSFYPYCSRCAISCYVFGHYCVCGMIL